MKAMSTNARWLVLGSLLLVTVISVFLLEDQESNLVEMETGNRGQKIIKKPDNAIKQSANKETDQPLISQWFEKKFAEPVTEQLLHEGALDPFRKKTWYVPPPPPPPPKPKAPPLPFQFLGRLQADGDGRVFLLHQGKNLIVKQGDVIADQYRVDEVH